MVAAEFFTFLFFLFRSYDPIRKLSRQHNELAKAFAAARDVWSVLDEEAEFKQEPNAREIPSLTDKIELRDVTFSYGKRTKDILKSINLEIAKGSMVALVGESGGGKSSLIRLVQRLYDPT